MAMKRMLVPACCLGAVGAAPPSDDQIDTMWARFKTDYPKNYASEASRFVAFKTNVLLAQSMNEDQGVTCTDLFDGEDCVFGITKFSDMFEDEFAKTKLGYTPKTGPSNAEVLDVQQLGAAPTSVDWRTKGAVSPVKDQGQCGRISLFCCGPMPSDAAPDSPLALPWVRTEYPCRIWGTAPLGLLASWWAAPPKPFAPWGLRPKILQPSEQLVV